MKKQMRSSADWSKKGRSAELLTHSSQTTMRVCAVPLIYKTVRGVTLPHDLQAWILGFRSHTWQRRKQVLYTPRSEMRSWRITKWE